MLNKLVFENLRHRPIRTCLSVLAIGVEVTMILTLVGISYGTLDETARRARGVGADILVRPPASSMKVIDYLAEELKKSEPLVDYLAEELKREQQKREAKPGVKAMGKAAGAGW